MKIQFGKRRIILPLMLLLATAVAFAAVPVIRKVMRPDSVDTVAAVKKVYSWTREDKAIVKEMLKVTGRLDTLADMTMMGRMSVVDLADTTMSMKESFTFLRKDSMAYYKLGSVEMVSLSDAYITIHHDAKKILVAPPRIAEGLMPALSLEPDLLKEEEYTITKSLQGDSVIYKLEQPNHVSCRLYRITADNNGNMKQCFMRATAAMNPFDADKDKLVTVDIASWKIGSVPLAYFNTQRYFTIEDGVLKPGAGFSGYEIVTLQ